MHTPDPKLLFIAAALSSVCSLTNVRAQVVFTALGPGTVLATDVSDDGATVVGWSGNGIFRWTKTNGVTSLNPVDGYTADGAAFVSSDGSVISGNVYKNSDPMTRSAFRWTQFDGGVILGSLTTGTASSASGLSGDGATVVGGASRADGTHEAFRWTQAEGMIGLGTSTSSGSNSGAHAISENGLGITGATIFADGSQQAFLWTQANGAASLGKFDGKLSTSGWGINSDASIVIGGYYDQYAHSPWKPFRWTASEGMISLNPSSEFIDATPFGVSDDGAVIIGGVTQGGFIWTPDSGMRDLLDVLNNDYGISDQTRDWDFLQPHAISPDGRYIVGIGSNGGWLLDRGVNPPPISVALAPVPEPSMFGLAGAVVLTSAILRRRFCATPKTSRHDSSTITTNRAFNPGV